MSARTSNSHLASVKAFFGYLVKDGLVASNPLKRISKANEAADPRLERRPFSTDEMMSLLDVTEKADETFHPSFDGNAMCAAVGGGQGQGAGKNA